MQTMKDRQRQASAPIAGGIKTCVPCNVYGHTVSIQLYCTEVPLIDTVQQIHKSSRVLLIIHAIIPKRLTGVYFSRQPGGKSPFGGEVAVRFLLLSSS
jgi:hypothetical protein